MVVDGIRNQVGSRVTWNLAQAQSPVVNKLVSVQCRVSGDTTLRFFGSAAVFAHQQVPYVGRR